MNFEAIEKALVLQNRAYKLLLWLGIQAQHSPEWLGQDLFSNSTSTELWLKRHLNRFPEELRPGLQEIEPFAFALSSFFSTSFHIEPAAEGTGLRLVRGAKKFADRRNKRHATQRADNDAAELKRLALASLAAAENIVVEQAAVESLWQDAGCAQALTLWTYGSELVRRSEYASQGPAVHRLWLELTEKQRHNLTAEAIWKARSQLVRKLKNLS